MLSIFELFKIGIGPSSSHTVGPMLAAAHFSQQLADEKQLNRVTRIDITLYGSLALTGRGHQTDVAIWFGLAGEQPQQIDVSSMPLRLQRWQAGGELRLNGQHPLAFDAIHLFFEPTPLTLHENGLRLVAYQGEAVCLEQTWYSLGGGFIVREDNFHARQSAETTIPYPFASAEELLGLCQQAEISIASLMLCNEQQLQPERDVAAECQQIWRVMKEAIARGSRTEGVLPGPLRVPRRAPALYRQLASSEALSRDPMLVIDWVNAFALAVSEENAAGGRIVTAPTNGAAGILPAVLAYYDRFVQPVDATMASHFLLTAGAIGLLYKMNASLSGAEVGCQGEVGVACSMAAAGLTALMGGSPDQVCQAAEIGMEHNLGLTCDPVAGQVQVPCIERNAIAAVKAINASRMALRRTSKARVSLDKVIETMYATGKDMDARYRETSRGGLAIRILPCD
ncbi:L-serine ammonia-lyase [Pseudaeromonas sharmana]|uniref:L-serine dehydratase n=1 Tax=Pseudaeromonas sharmana TaxID=328412 RepID=A0ABV8CPU2_9GAMM